MTSNIFFGFILSILATIAGSYLYLEFIIPGSFEASWKWMLENHEQSSILSLGAIPNLLLFFVFIKRKEDYKARGVLMGVVLIALVVLGFKIL
jgi:hypothetical protein